MDEVDVEERVAGLLKARFTALRDCGIARRAGNVADESDAGTRLVLIDREITALLKADERKLKALLKLPAGADGGARVAQLLAAFRHGARLKRIWKDLMGSTSADNRIAKLTYSVLGALDAIGDGRRLALEPFLDDKDADVRAMSASALSDIIPERAVPVLQEVSRNSRWLSAGWTALMALTIHESGTARVSGGDKQ